MAIASKRILRKQLNGYILPTDAERAEGMARRRFALDPDDDCFREQLRAATAKVYAEQDRDVPLVICSLCHTRKPCALPGQPCVVCKCRDTYYG